VDPERIARELIVAFDRNDLSQMRVLLADDLRAYITNRDGGVDQTDGSGEYLRRIEAMDLPSAEFRTEIAQSVTVRPDTVMIMVEVHAARRGRTLHNHAAHLLFIRDGRVAEWWMVEALPAESDSFWSA
jgi:ketosteroid isomerase-like protein